MWGNMYKERIVSWVRRVLPWSLPIKLVLSAFLGVLGGAGLLGYLSEYATYNYAIQYGIRPPLEGIPYLRPAVAFGSIFLLFTGALVFVIVAGFCKTLAWYVDLIPQVFVVVSRIFKQPVPKSQLKFGRLFALARAQSNTLVVIFSSSLATFALVVAWVVIYFFDLKNVDGEKVEFNLPIAIFLFFYVFLAMLAMLRPKLVYWISIIFTVLYFVFCIYLIFSPVKYSELLRVLGYGGGYSVNVQLREEGSEKKPLQKYQLMLRTNEAFIFYDSIKSEIIEIPRDQVRSIVHGVGGMSKLQSVLPERIEFLKNPILAR